MNPQPLLRALEKQVVEIHLPSRITLTINARKLVDLIAKATDHYPHNVFNLLGTSGLLPLVFRVPLAWIYLHREHKDAVGPTHEDYALWDELRAQRVIRANPVTLHITGVEDETPAPQRELSKEELAAEINSGVKKALELLQGGDTLRAESLLQGVQLALQGVERRVAVDDGWGHTTQDASVEDLLREGAAAAEGTDKHEQVIQQLLGEDNAKGAVEMLLKALKEQGHHIRQLQQGRIDDLKRLHELGEWLNHEASLNPEGPVLQQVLMTFGLQLSRIGIAPKVCPACQPR